MNHSIDDNDPQWWRADKRLTLVDPNQPPLKPGSPRATTVFGDDDRTYVGNVLREPFQWICQVLGYSTNDRSGVFSVGSGFVIGRRTILTAGHNLWVEGRRVQQCWVFPAVDGDRSAPTLGGYRARATFAHPIYEQSRNNDLFDVAMLVLDDLLPSDLVTPQYGAMHWQAIDPAILRGAVGLVSGYPKNVPRQPESANTQAHQYFAFAPLAPQKGLACYTIDTTAGQSGSPLLVKLATTQGPQLTAVGVHINGGDERTSLPNSAAPITPAVGNFIRTIQNQYEPTHLA